MPLSGRVDGCRVAGGGCASTTPRCRETGGAAFAYQFMKEARV